MEKLRSAQLVLESALMLPRGRWSTAVRCEDRKFFDPLSVRNSSTDPSPID